MITLIVQSKRIGPIRGRHPWVFSGALKQIPEGVAGGEPVELTDEAGHFLAAGYFNSYSQIAVRLWSWEPEEVDHKFFEKRIKNALALREEFVSNKNTNAYRLINGESDFLPGLIVDVYGDYLTVQFHNPGIERWRTEIIDSIVKIMKPKGIFERSDMRARGIEGAEKKVGLLYGKIPAEVKIKENGYSFIVDIKEGQKTGFFLDQRDKRQALIKYSKNKKVLNCFSYTGGFSVYALGGGAKKVVSVDSSEPALLIAEKNVQLNKFEEKSSEYILADVKEYLVDRKEGEFDVIILDPPAFAKDRHKIHEALQGYRKINEMALRVLSSGGILFTCSCSAHISLTDFRFMLSEAAARAGKSVQIIETFTHGIDHPVLVPLPKASI
ncbi:MAG: class I SAM-dependent rRNA methyltransferase [Candidatus Magasanikbacteria bacterium]